MLVYGAILPHATLLHRLIADDSPALPDALRKAFDTVASDLHGRGIKDVICISAHPRFTREGFSAYVSDAYTLGFRDLGDLSNEETVPMDWTLYDRLRETSARHTPILHPIDEKQLDLSHALPLSLLTRSLPADGNIRFLCLNDHVGALPAERLAFGESLKEAIDSLAQPIAVILSTEAMIADQNDAGAFEAAKTINLDLRYQANGLWAKPLSEVVTSSVACAIGPMNIARPLFASPKPWTYEELAFEHVAPTSLLAARLLPPRSA